MQTGVFFCSRAVGRVMIDQGKGTVVNISSIRGYSANPGRLAYCAAKAAVIIMTEVMAGEWGPLGIRVNAIAPGVVATGMWKEEVARGPLSRGGLHRDDPLAAPGRAERDRPAVRLPLV